MLFVDDERNQAGIEVKVDFSDFEEGVLTETKTLVQSKEKYIKLYVFASTNQ